MKDFAELLAAVAAMLNVTGTVVVIFLSYWNKRTLEEVHRTTNSKMDVLLKVVGESEHAKGLKQGLEEGKQ